MTSVIKVNGRDSPVGGQKSFYDGDRALLYLTFKLPILKLHRFETNRDGYETLRRNYFKSKQGRMAPCLYAMTFTTDSKTWDLAKSLCEKGLLGRPTDIITKFLGNKDLYRQDFSSDYIPNPEETCGVLWATGEYEIAYMLSDFIQKHYNLNLLPRENSINLTNQMIGATVSYIEEKGKQLEDMLRIIKENNRKLIENNK